jgi:hypothetical protein
LKYHIGSLLTYVQERIIKYANNKRAITIRSTTTTPAMSPALDVGLAAVDVVNAVIILTK